MNEPARGAPDGATDAVSARAPSTGPQSAPPTTIPADATPTWQVELLLSGGVVFALLQLPSRLDAQFDWARPRLDEAWWEVAVFLYLYAKVALLAMICAFVAHLAIRTLWVALIGLDSVYPRGIRWESLRMGPISRELAAADAQPLRAAAARIDNLASLVFATGTLVAALSLSVLATTLILLALSQLLAALAPGWREDDARNALILLVVLPPLLAYALDRLLGARLAPAGAAWRTVRTLHLSQRLFMPARSLRQMLWVLTSNLGRYRGSAVVVGLFYVLATVVAAEVLLRTGAYSLDRYTYIARGDGFHALVAEHYRSRREGSARYSTLPSIDAPVVEGDWIELFLPFQPRRHPRQIAAACPGLAPEPVPGSDAVQRATAVAAEAARRAAVLTCLAVLHPVTLNGAAVPNLRWDFYTDPATGMAGLLAMIPIDGLPRGRHELAIARLQEPVVPDRKPDAPEPWRIPFWK